MTVNSLVACSLCTIRAASDGNGLCFLCGFFYSPQEQQVYEETIDRILSDPQVLNSSLDTQTNHVIGALPYICTYKAQHLIELRCVISGLLQDTIISNDDVISVKGGTRYYNPSKQEMAQVIKYFRRKIT